MAHRQQPSFGTAVFAAIALGLAAYFLYAGLKGDYGLLRRIQIEAEAEELRAERDRMEAEVAWLRNLTRRLSDDYLDLDLLDERAREMLGMIRADEIVIR